jgi:hypothetical protein
VSRYDIGLDKMQEIIDGLDARVEKLEDTSVMFKYDNPLAGKVSPMGSGQITDEAEHSYDNSAKAFQEYKKEAEKKWKEEVGQITADPDAAERERRYQENKKNFGKKRADEIAAEVHIGEAVTVTRAELNEDLARFNEHFSEPAGVWVVWGSTVREARPETLALSATELEALRHANRATLYAPSAPVRATFVEFGKALPGEIKATFIPSRG